MAMITSICFAVNALELAYAAPSLEQSSESVAVQVDQSLLQVGARTNMGHAFAHYNLKFGRNLQAGSTEYLMREDVFYRRLAEIQSHNEQIPRPHWRAGINHLTDRTNEELSHMRGYRRHQRRFHVDEADEAGEPVSLLGKSSKSCTALLQKCSGRAGGSCCNGLICGISGTCEQAKGIPEHVDWTTMHQSVQNIVNQGECGSCWAIAAQGAVELQASILSNRSLSLSAQGMLACTPNPHECGGTGGCGGATPELALQWATENGVVSTSSVPYTADSVCPEPATKPEVMIGGFVQLKENRAKEVLQTLVNVGPLAVAVDASQWSLYMSGVFDNCAKEPIVDHAVLLVGYGKDTKISKPFWKIRNSWGPEFGEHGFLRLRRHAPQGEEPCGWDYDPQKGNGCKGGPSKVWVCGECGVLSDVVYPVGTKVIAMS